MLDEEMGHMCNNNCKRVAYVSFYKKTYTFEGCWYDESFLFNVKDFMKSLMKPTTHGTPLLSWDHPTAENYMDHTRFGSLPQTTPVKFVS